MPQSPSHLRIRVVHCTSRRRAVAPPSHPRAAVTQAGATRAHNNAAASAEAAQDAAKASQAALDAAKSGNDHDEWDDYLDACQDFLKDICVPSQTDHKNHLYVQVQAYFAKLFNSKMI